ncbi:MAG: hypothetical protein E7315_06445 [Clostridiales bacterium]|nr:hypothetical protein [Clostridiales bacterium]
MKKRKIWTIILSVLLVCVVVAGFVNSDLFDIKEIRVTVDNGDENAIRLLTQLCEAKEGDNLLKVNTDKIIKAIDASGRFENISVSRKYPDVLIVRASMRKNNALLEIGENSYIVIDKNGVAIETLNSPYNDTAVVYCGIRISQYVISQEVISKDAHQMGTVKLMMRLFAELNLEEHIDRVYLGDLSNVYMISETGKKIRIAMASEVEEKIRMLAKKECIDFLYSEEDGYVELYSDCFVIKKSS